MSCFEEEKNLLKIDIYKLSMQVADMLMYSIDVLDHVGERDRSIIKSRYLKIQRFQFQTEEKVASIAAGYIADEEEIRDIVAAIRIAVHLERIAARSMYIAFVNETETIKELKEDFLQVKKMLGKCVDLFISVMESYKNEDSISARKNLFRDLEIISSYQRFNIRISSKIRKDPENTDSYIKLINLNRDIERLASHIMSISTWIHYIITGEHVFLENLPE